MKICFSQNCKKIFFYQKYGHLGEHTLIHCSQRTVVHVVNQFWHFIAAYELFVLFFSSVLIESGLPVNVLC